MISMTTAMAILIWLGITGLFLIFARVDRQLEAFEKMKRSYV
jgi:hypothetical protein